MIGISRYGAYLPTFRLDRRLIEQAWGAKQPQGEVAVANYDEDALTLAIDAAMGCLGDPPAPVGGVYVASASLPYVEKQASSLLATALRPAARHLHRRLRRLGARRRQRHAGRACAPCKPAPRRRCWWRRPTCGWPRRRASSRACSGDGAAALTIADHDVIAEFVDAASVAEEFTYVWRTDQQRTVQVAGGRFSNVYGYGRDLGAAITTLLERQGLDPAAIAKLALYSPDARASADLAKSLGFDPEDPAGRARCSRRSAAPATPSRCCCWRARSTRASPGELILVGGYGEGADVLLFRATDAIAVAPRRDAGRALAGGQDAAAVVREVPEVPPPDRGRGSHRRGHQRARVQGAEAGRPPLRQPLPRLRPGAVPDGARLHPLPGAGAHGRTRVWRAAARVFTFTVDHLIPNLEHPLPMAVIDADGGGRLYLQVADADDIAIGAPVRLHLPPPARGRRQPQLLLEGAADAGMRVVSGDRRSREGTHEGPSRRHRRRLHEVRRSLRAAATRT